MKIVSLSARFRLIYGAVWVAAWGTVSAIGIAPAYSFDPPPSEGTPVRTIGGSTRSDTAIPRPLPSPPIFQP